MAGEMWRTFLEAADAACDMVASGFDPVTVVVVGVHSDPHYNYGLQVLRPERLAELDAWQRQVLIMKLRDVASQIEAMNGG